MSTAGLRELGLVLDPYVNMICRLNDRSVYGLLKDIGGLSYIDGPTPQVFEKQDGVQDDVGTAYRATDIVHAVETVEIPANMGAALRAVSSYEIHRRLGHAGKAKQASTTANAILVEGSDDLINEDFHSEACGLGNSKQLISRDPQHRVEKAGIKFHADLQMMEPIGTSGERYWMPLVDDATRFIEGPCFQNKSQVSDWLIRFCKRQKLQRGYYPSTWRFDGGTEFLKFKSWAENESMTIEITPPYTPQANGTAERLGGHINEMQRTIEIDIDIEMPF